SPEGGFVEVDLVEIEVVRVRLVLQHVEAQTAGLVTHGAGGVVLGSSQELVTFVGLDLEGDDEGKHCAAKRTGVPRAYARRARGGDAGRSRLAGWRRDTSTTQLQKLHN